MAAPATQAAPISSDAPPQHGLNRNPNQLASEMFPAGASEVSLVPLSGRVPVDLPDEFDTRVPDFVSRRKAGAMPELHPAPTAKGFGWSARLSWLAVGLALGGLIGRVL